MHVTGANVISFADAEVGEKNLLVAQIIAAVKTTIDAPLRPIKCGVPAPHIQIVVSVGKQNGGIGYAP